MPDPKGVKAEEFRTAILAELRSWDKRFDSAETIADNIVAICRDLGLLGTEGQIDRLEKFQVM